MNLKQSIAEIINDAAKTKDVADKVTTLQAGDAPALRTILRLIYDKEINFLIPDSAPPFKPNGAIENTETMLYRESRRMKIFIEGGGYDNLQQSKRENLFIGLLEDLHPSDAKLLVENVVPHKAVKGVTRKVVEEAFPDLFTTPMDMR
jgi:hypothetical protein